MHGYRANIEVFCCSLAAGFALSACAGGGSEGVGGSVVNDAAKNGIAVLPAVSGRGTSPRDVRRAVSQPTCSSGGMGIFVGGGSANVAGASDAAVVAGQTNDACSANSFVGAGDTNGIDGSSESAAIVAGEFNAVTTGAYSAIVGGGSNSVNGGYAFIGGGASNSLAAEYGVIAGGDLNKGSGELGFIGSGNANTLEPGGAYGVLVGGFSNTIDGQYGFIGAGSTNVVTGEYGVLNGGYNNKASGEFSAVGGGESNQAPGQYAAIPGGQLNRANGQGSFAAGMGSNANDNGDFVWSDDPSGGGVTPITVTGNNEFLARARGGVTFYTSANLASGVTLAPGSGTWSSLSDRNVKTGILPVSDDDILAKVAALPISEWSYTTERGVRHVGPMAQDFYAAFNVGEDDRHITSIDEDGVALAAIKALAVRTTESEAALTGRLAQKDAQIRSLRAELRAKDAVLQRRAERPSRPSEGAAPGSPVDLPVRYPDGKPAETADALTLAARRSAGKSTELI